MKSFKDKFVQTLKSLGSTKKSDSKTDKSDKDKAAIAKSLEKELAVGVKPKSYKQGGFLVGDEIKAAKKKAKKKKTKISPKRKARNLDKKSKKRKRKSKKLGVKQSGKKFATKNEQRRHK